MILKTFAYKAACDFSFSTRMELSDWQQEHQAGMKPVLQELVKETSHIEQFVSSSWHWWAEQLKEGFPFPEDQWHLIKNYTREEMESIRETWFAEITELAEPKYKEGVSGCGAPAVIKGTKCVDCFYKKPHLRDHSPHRREWFILCNRRPDHPESDVCCRMITVVSETPKGGLTIKKNM